MGNKFITKKKDHIDNIYVEKDNILLNDLDKTIGSPIFDDKHQIIDNSFNLTPKTNFTFGHPQKESPEERDAINAKSTKEYTVKLVDRKVISDFMEKWHYSHSINGLIADYCFGLYYKNTLIGAMIYGRMAMHNQYKKYSEHKGDVIELRRLACIDDTLRNTESYFIAKTIKWLKHNTDIKVIVSYANLFYKHVGTIYKASNFKLLGKTNSGRLIIYKNKIYHDHSIRTKYHGELKPFAAKLKKALEDHEAYYVKTPQKNIYIYKIK